MSDLNSKRDNNYDENSESYLENVLESILENDSQKIKGSDAIIWFILKKVYLAGYWDGCKDPCCHHHHYREDK